MNFKFLFLFFLFFQGCLFQDKHIQNITSNESNETYEIDDLDLYPIHQDSNQTEEIQQKEIITQKYYALFPDSWSILNKTNETLYLKKQSCSIKIDQILSDDFDSALNPLNKNSKVLYSIPYTFQQKTDKIYIYIQNIDYQKCAFFFPIFRDDRCTRFLMCCDESDFAYNLDDFKSIISSFEPLFTNEENKRTFSTDFFTFNYSFDDDFQFSQQSSIYYIYSPALNLNISIRNKNIGSFSCNPMQTLESKDFYSDLNGKKLICQNQIFTEERIYLFGKQTYLIQFKTKSKDFYEKQMLFENLLQNIKFKS